MRSGEIPEDVFMAWRTVTALGIGAALLVSCAAARAVDCPGNSNAIGTSRVLTVEPSRHAHVGTMQYPTTLPLADREVVLTFDDGPMPPYTNRILDVLSAHCVKANYFVIGRMARGYPDLTKRIYHDGHVIGTHSENHPLGFDKIRCRPCNTRSSKASFRSRMRSASRLRSLRSSVSPVCCAPMQSTSSCAHAVL